MIKTYISIKAHEAIGDACASRNMEEIIIESNKLYEGLKQNLKKVIAGEDDVAITRVIDRKIGKTYSIIKLALEFGLPIVVPSYRKSFYQRYSQQLFNKDIQILCLCERKVEKANNIDIVLKDQGISTYEIIELFKPKKVKIIGISSMFDE